MFTMKVDEDIELGLVDRTFAKHYIKATRENYEHLMKWMGWPLYCRTEQEFYNFINGYLHEYAAGRSVNCGIFYKDEMVGGIGFHFIDYTLGKLQIGYWLIKSAQGNGIVTRACKRMIEYAFNDLNMRKVEIRVAPENNRSCAVCERLGMRLEGVITCSENLNGKVVDHMVYGLARQAV